MFTVILGYLRGDRFPELMLFLIPTSVLLQITFCSMRRNKELFCLMVKFKPPRGKCFTLLGSSLRNPRKTSMWTFGSIATLGISAAYTAESSAVSDPIMMTNKTVCGHT